MKYVRCIKNETLYEDDEAETYAPFLIVGRVYKVAPPEKNDQPYDLRVIDGEGEDYLYPADYFEPVALTNEALAKASATVTIHLAPLPRDILQAEAIAAKKPVSVLMREWIDERLDLPIGG